MNNLRSTWLCVSLILTAMPALSQTCNDNMASSTPTSQFELSDTGTAKDTRTGLVWMRCALGQTWDADTGSCTGSVVTYTWTQALEQGASTTFAGYNDWRLPNIKELGSIVEAKCAEPAINLTVFSSASRRSFLSSTPLTGSSQTGWLVKVNGHYGLGRRIFAYAVRLVRAGQ